MANHGCDSAESNEEARANADQIALKRRPRRHSRGSKQSDEASLNAHALRHFQPAHGAGGRSEAVRLQAHALQR